MRAASIAASSFSVFKRSMMQDDELPLSNVIDDQRFADAFERHGIDFGNGGGDVYTPSVTLWGLVSQVFFSGAQRSTKAAVTRISSLWAMLGRVVCRSNHGAYCKARMTVRLVDVNVEWRSQAAALATSPQPFSTTSCILVSALPQSMAVAGRWNLTSEASNVRWGWTSCVQRRLTWSEPNLGRAYSPTT
jgi:hypothetical protein